MSADEIPQAAALRPWLAMLAGNEPDGGDLELRHKPRGGAMRRLGFYPTRDRERIGVLISRAAKAGDVWAGVAPRREVYRRRDHKRSGGLDAIARVWCLWVDADTPDACGALRTFEPAASVLVCSGNGLHGYWPLRRPLTPADAKRANRRLAHKLGADTNACDGARVMRPPGTLNHKTPQPKPVTCERLELTIYTAREIVKTLPDPPRAPVKRLPSRAAADAPATIDGLLDTVRHAPHGQRNAALYWAASRLAEHLGRGELDLNSSAALHLAAQDAGLEDLETEQTIRSALTRHGVAA
jgi:hypothetical protein